MLGFSLDFVGVVLRFRSDFVAICVEIWLGFRLDFAGICVLRLCWDFVWTLLVSVSRCALNFVGSCDEIVLRFCLDFV